MDTDFDMKDGICGQENKTDVNTTGKSPINFPFVAHVEKRSVTITKRDMHRLEGNT